MKERIKKMERARTEEGAMLCVKLAILANYERGSYRTIEFGKREKKNRKID